MPTIQQTSWWRALFIIISGLVFSTIIAVIIGSLVGIPLGISMFAIVFTMVNLLIQQYLARKIKLIQQGNYSGAIQSFENMYAYFQRNKWLDKYRHIFLLNVSAISFGEMALLNIAFCYGQMGEPEKLKQILERTLAEFPNSLIAKNTLNLINTVAANPTKIE
jgi:tetratricopeptide (TPR) repeat protein